MTKTSYSIFWTYDQDERVKTCYLCDDPFRALSVAEYDLKFTGQRYEPFYKDFSVEYYVDNGMGVCNKLFCSVHRVRIVDSLFRPGSVPDVLFFPDKVAFFSQDLVTKESQYSLKDKPGFCVFRLSYGGFHVMQSNWLYKFLSSDFWVSWDGRRLGLHTVEVF